jgi:outer membrane immunogenic protein
MSQLRGAHNGGVQMKKLFVAALAGLAFTAGSAKAADVGRPVYKAPRPMVAPVPVFTWTGCYVGVEGGGNWGSASNFSFDPRFPGDITGTYHLSGGMAGGTIGCNIQTGQFVFGIEADDSWTNKRGSRFAIPPFSPNALIQTQENWIATIRGRFGYAFADRWLAYVTGGAAATDARLTISDAHFANDTGVAASESQTRWGWTVGGGLEWAKPSFFLFLPGVLGRRRWRNIMCHSTKTCLAPTVFRSGACKLRYRWTMHQPLTRRQ